MIYIVTELKIRYASVTIYIINNIYYKIFITNMVSIYISIQKLPIIKLLTISF